MTVGRTQRPASAGTSSSSCGVRRATRGRSYAAASDRRRDLGQRPEPFEPRRSVGLAARGLGARLRLRIRLVAHARASLTRQAGVGRRSPGRHPAAPARFREPRREAGATDRRPASEVRPSAARAARQIDERRQPLRRSGHAHGAERRDAGSAPRSGSRASGVLGRRRIAAGRSSRHRRRRCLFAHQGIAGSAIAKRMRRRSRRGWRKSIGRPR